MNTVISLPSGAGVVFAFPGPREATQALVLGFPDTLTSWPCIEAFGGIFAGHRYQLFSGRTTPYGSVTPGSNHTHFECELNQSCPQERRSWQLATVDAAGVSWIIGTYHPAALPDATHQFFETAQQWMKVGKAADAEGVQGVALGGRMQYVAGETRIGFGSSYMSIARDGAIKIVCAGRVVFERTPETAATQTAKVAPPPMLAVGLSLEAALRDAMEPHEATRWTPDPDAFPFVGSHVEADADYDE